MIAHADKGTKPLCERDVCPKGHWSRPLVISEIDRRFVTIVKAAMETGAEVLTEAERTDALFIEAMAEVATLIRAIQSQRSAVVTGRVVGGIVQAKQKR